MRIKNINKFIIRVLVRAGSHGRDLSDGCDIPKYPRNKRTAAGRTKPERDIARADCASRPSPIARHLPATAGPTRSLIALRIKSTASPSCLTTPFYQRHRYECLYNLLTKKCNNKNSIVFFKDYSINYSLHRLVVTEKCRLNFESARAREYLFLFKIL